MRSWFKSLLSAVLALSVLFAAPPTQAAPRYATAAADLRVTLNSLLTEHTALAASATGAALAGREAQFNAVAASLDANSVDLSKAIGSVYGADAEKAFLPLWRSHIGFVVEYTQGLAAKDTAKSDKAVADLLKYSEDFGAFLSGANPNLTKAAVADLVKMHILSLKDVIDAQAAGDPTKQFSALRSAYSHMDMIGKALAGAIAKQFPDKFSGAADGAAADLKASLNLVLQEHAYLAARATGAALGGREPEFNAAAASLDANSVDLSKAIGSVYGADAEKAFLPLWRSHIGFVVEYTQGLAAKDTAKSDKAVADLLKYSEDFGAFLSGANPNLPKATVADLVKTHILTLKAVIDAQAAGDQPKVYGELRTAFAHMSMIANPLADAIVAQFPDKFGGATAAPAPAKLPTTAEGDGMPWAIYAALVALLALAGGWVVLRSVARAPQSDTASAAPASAGQRRRTDSNDDIFGGSSQ